MYIEQSRGVYSQTGNQEIRRANFLILLQPKEWERRGEPIKAIVRQVALKQFGHWMMGYARAYGQTLTLSGSYGSDGLPVSNSEVYDRATVVLPDELVEAWNTGGGWNGAGSEAEAMRQWALDNLKELKR